MSRSQVSIVNRALDILGASNITSITDNSVSARAMNRAYEPVLTWLLEKHDWTFAIKRIELSESVSTPDYEFNNQFALPLDYIRILEVYPKYLRYKVEAGYVLVNASSLRIRYVRQVEDPNEFSAEFAELLAKALAKETCYKITQNRSKEADLKAEFKEAYLWASSNNSKASGTLEPFANDNIMIHRGYGADDENNAVVSDSFDYGSVS